MSQFCRHLLFSVLLFAPAVGLYADADVEIDFDDELDALETKAKASVTGNKLDAELNRLETVHADDDRAGSWGADIQRWNESATASDNKQKQDKLAAIKKRCTCFWKECPSASAASALVLTSKRGASAWDLADIHCRKGVTFKTRQDVRRLENCRHRRALNIEENWEREARERRAEQKRREENARRAHEANRSYCAAARDDVAAGRLPTTSDPGWTPVNEQSFRDVIDRFDEDHKARIDDIEARHLRTLQGRREQEERDAAADSLRAERAAKAAAVQSQHDQWCQIQLGLGHAPCGCDLPEDATACDK